MHYTGFGTRSIATPQTEPIPGREHEMVANNAAGFVFQLDDMQRLNRFLVIGSNSNTMYVTARKLTKDNLDAVERLLKAGRGKEVIDTIIAISDQGRAISNDPALFALARCCAADDKSVSRYAYDALPKVARTGTHLLHFVEYVKQFRGRGRQHRRAIRAWYQDKPVEKLAYQVVKYQQRDGWSQRDVLRLARPNPADMGRDALYHWIVKGDMKQITVTPITTDMEPAIAGPLDIIYAYEHVKKATSDKEVARLISRYRLPREAVPTEHLKSIRVWEALLEDMPMEAMVRNLATMTRNGVLESMGTFTHSVVTRLHSRDAIHKARLHPIKILAALTTYQSGKSARGSSTWTPLREVVDALNDAFYLAFQCVEPSKKRLVIGLDVSGSMGWGEINGIPGMTPRVASAALSLVTAATEPHYTIMGFGHEFVPLNISPKQRLDDVVRTISGLPFGNTDCALPMGWAMEHNVQADAFVILTDNETWIGSKYGHPVQALQAYRRKFDIPAKLIVVGMTATGFTIADPHDSGMIDVIGLDTATPEMISSFIQGKI